MGQGAEKRRVRRAHVMASASMRIRFRRRAIVSAYAAVLVVFLCVLGRFYEPGAGFAYLVTFGANQNLPQISEFKR